MRSQSAEVPFICAAAFLLKKGIAMTWIIPFIKLINCSQVKLLLIWKKRGDRDAYLLEGEALVRIAIEHAN